MIINISDLSTPWNNVQTNLLTIWQCKFYDIFKYTKGKTTQLSRILPNAFDYSCKCWCLTIDSSTLNRYVICMIRWYCIFLSLFSYTTPHDNQPPQRTHTDSSGALWQNHDDVITWKLFPRYWPFLLGIHQLLVNVLHNGRWRGDSMLSWSAPE